MVFKRIVLLSELRKWLRSVSPVFNTCFPFQKYGGNESSK